MFGLSGRVAHARHSDRVIGLTCTATDPDLLSAWSQRTGEPAGLGDVLADLDRRGRPATVRRTRTAAAFEWDAVDSSTRAWVPQGITTSADAEPAGSVHGRDVVAVSWYSPKVSGTTEGVRITLVDVTTAGNVRYRHVLLVEPAWQPEDGVVTTLPVPVHAGGIVWYGDLLYVASTYRGLRVFDLRDLLRVDPDDHGGFGYVLPQRWAYPPMGDPAARMRYSFVSLDRTSTPHSLVAGEYGRGGAPTQIARFSLDAATRRLHSDAGTATPSEAFGLDVLSMQGVACVDGTYVVTTSRSRFLRGDLWVGGPRRGFRQHRWALPAGPEDLSMWRSRRQLWTLTEWAGHRAVFALRADDWLGPAGQRPRSS